MKKLVITLLFLAIGTLYVYVLELFDYDILQVVASMLLGGVLSIAILFTLMEGEW